MLVYPIAFVSVSKKQIDPRQLLWVAITLILAAFFVALDILRTYWNLNISLGDTTNLIFLWRLLEPDVAVILSATSRFTDLEQDDWPTSDIPDDHRSWIEIGAMNKDVSD